MGKKTKYIWINGCQVEVSEEIYDVYMKGSRKMRYFEYDLKYEKILRDKDGYIKGVVASREDSLERLMEQQFRQFSDNSGSTEDIVLCRITIQELHKALAKLGRQEQELIFSLFFEKKTEREVAAEMGVSQPAVHKRKCRILEKIKNLMKYRLS